MVTSVDLEAVKWLERLEQGEISSVVRRDLEVQLTPVQVEQRVRKYGDFTEHEYYLRLSLRAPPEERYQERKNVWYFHESS
jgi:hypothetical protein